MTRINSKLVVDENLTKKFKLGIIKEGDIVNQMQNHGYTLSFRFGFIDAAQHLFKSHFNDKIWQLDKLPDNVSPVNFSEYESLFIDEEKYGELFGDYIKDLRALINKVPELDFMKSWSDVRLMDRYGHICFTQPTTKLCPVGEISEEFLKHIFMTEDLMWHKTNLKYGLDER